MKAIVIEENCIGCGQCESICGEVFKLNDEGVAVASESEIKEEFLSDADLAKDSCPTNAIEIK